MLGCWSKPNAEILQKNQIQCYSQLASSIVNELQPRKYYDSLRSTGVRVGRGPRCMVLQPPYGWCVPPASPAPPPTNTPACAIIAVKHYIYLTVAGD